MKKMMLYDPQTKNDNIVLCFKNRDNFNELNGDQFICDISFKTAIQIIESCSLSIDVDINVKDYIRKKSVTLSEVKDNE